jgi:hypothetical protein
MPIPTEVKSNTIAAPSPSILASPQVAEQISQPRAVKNSPQTQFEVPASSPKAEAVQAMRLGGTETSSRKNNRTDSETTPVDRTPRSFWGVRVVKEVSPKQAEELHRAASVTPKAPTSEGTVIPVALPATQPVQSEPMASRPLSRKKEPASESKTEVRQAAPDAVAVAGEPKHVAATSGRMTDQGNKKNSDDPGNQSRQAEVKLSDRPVSEKAAPNAADIAPTPVKNEQRVDAVRSANEDNAVPTPAANQPVKELPTAPTFDVPALKAQFTVEQIKELQALVSKSLQGSRLTVDGGKEAVFNWNHDALGPLSFRVSMRNDDVEIRIQYGRKDVAEALEEGRGTIERMITDLGLRVERFEVKVRAEGMAQDNTRQTQEREHPDHNRRPEAGGETSGGMSLDSEPELEAIPTKAPWADREWVA